MTSTTGAASWHAQSFPKSTECLDEDCMICLDELAPIDRAQLVPCNHWQYHKDCIDKWMDLNTGCPYCKTNVDHIRWGLHGENKHFPFPPVSVRRRTFIMANMLFPPPGEDGNQSPPLFFRGPPPRREMTAFERARREHERDEFTRQMPAPVYPARAARLDFGPANIGWRRSENQTPTPQPGRRFPAGQSASPAPPNRRQRAVGPSAAPIPPSRRQRGAGASSSSPVPHSRRQRASGPVLAPASATTPTPANRRRTIGPLPPAPTHQDRDAPSPGNFLPSPARSTNMITPRAYISPRSRPHSPPPPPFPAYRLDVYIEGRFSLHVGVSRHSGYRVLRVEDFAHDRDLVSRATAFIRRELLVIDSLLPVTDRRLREVLGSNYWNQRVNYIMYVLREVDTQSANGAAEDMLGRILKEHTRLFLHEMRSFLKSPYRRLEDWDEVVTYGPPTRNTPGVP